MNKSIYYTLFLSGMLFCAKLSYSQTCGSNVDFESGSFTGWTGYTGLCCPISANNNGIMSGRHTIMTGNGFDAVIPSIPVVSPYGGTYSVRLGNDNTGNEAERLVISYTATAQNPSFTYQYAVILEDPNHSTSEQPRFQVTIKNQSGATIPCGYYNVVSGVGIPGFQSANGGDIVYKDWSLVAVDLTSYIGSPVTVEFQTGDCDLGGHFGYAYIDASCNPLQIVTDYCPGDPLALLTAPPGFQSYLWSTGQTTQSITAPNPTPGTVITVICTPFQGGNCATTLSYVFQQFPPVDANFSVNTSCGNNQVILTDSSTIQNGAQITSLQWIINNQVVGTQSPATYSFTAGGSYSITLIAQSNLGCPDTITKTVLIPQGLSGTTSVPSSLIYNGYGVPCSGSAVGNATVSASYGNPPYTYLWNTVPQSSNDTIFNLIDGTYIVTTTDATGCRTIDTAIVTAPPRIVVSPLIQNILCYGETTGSIQLNASGGVGTLAYQWSPNSSLTVPTATALSSGTYRFTITDDNACTFDSSLQITQPSAPFDVVSNSIAASCFGGCDGRIVVTSVTGNTAPYTYSWNTNPVQSANIAQNLCAGNYTCTVRDSNNCSTTESNVVSEPTELIMVLTTSNAFCTGTADGEISIQASGGTLPYSYTLILNGSTVASNGNGDFQNLVPNTYSVEVRDANGCMISQSVIISNPPPVTIQSIATDSANCFGYSDGSVSVIATGGTPPYEFVLDNTYYNSTGEFANLSKGTYQIVVFDSRNCSTSGNAVVNEPPQIIITATPDSLVLKLGETGTINASSNYDPLAHYQWEPWDGLDCYDCQEVSLTPYYNFEYTVTAITHPLELDCETKTTIPVTVIPVYDIFVPNAFTPNGDGVNDRFEFYGNKATVKYLEVQIFNRLGEKVFTSNNVNFLWDGTYKGVLQNTAVYVYTLTLVFVNNHTENNYKGSVTLIR